MFAQKSIVRIPLWSCLEMVELSIAKPNLRGHRNGVTPNTDLQYKLQKLKSRLADILFLLTRSLRGDNFKIRDASTPYFQIGVC